MHKLIAGIERSVVYEKQMWGIWIDFCDTDFTAIWADYAVELGKDVEDLTTLDKQRAHLNYVLRDRKGEGDADLDFC